MSALWGEIPSMPDSDPAITALEREQLSKPRCVDVEGPALHQPSLRHFPPVNEQLNSAHFDLDPLTQHTIQLVQYSRKVRVLIHNVRTQMQEQQKNEEAAGSITFPPLPQFPSYDGPHSKLKQQTPLTFVNKDFDSAFVRGEGKTAPEIEAKTCRKLLRKSVAAICAHSGYDNCRESVLETLTDISHEFYLKITGQLRVAVDAEALTGTTGFPDTMERVLQEMGIGSKASLHEFYQTRVIGYHGIMVKKCRALQQEYEKMKNPDYKFYETILFRSKDEPYGESSIHFPSSELDTEESVDDSIQLDSLGLDMSVSQDQSADEDSKWHHSIKTEASDSRVSNLEVYDQDDAQSTGTDIPPPHTPAMSSEAGSLHDPGSVSGPDMTSPPPASLGMRTSAKHPKKKKKI